VHIAELPSLGGELRDRLDSLGRCRCGDGRGRVRCGLSPVAGCQSFGCRLGIPWRRGRALFSARGSGRRGGGAGDQAPQGALRSGRLPSP
ncbi:unnamed protein product, partial [Symbiodinium necroappetens]